MISIIIIIIIIKIECILNAFEHFRLHLLCLFIINKNYLYKQ